MGFDSIWHLIIVLLVVAVPVVIIALVVVLIIFLARRSGATTAAGAPASAVASPAAVPRPSQTEQRLQDLAGLKAKGLITEAEYADRRTDILRNV